MKANIIDEFEKVEKQLEASCEEVGILSKKSPDGPINKFKLKFINNMLDRANRILGKEYKPFEEFDLFKEDELPTNSDVVLILSQYLRGLDKFLKDNTGYDRGAHWWIVDGHLSDRRSRVSKYQ